MIDDKLTIAAVLKPQGIRGEIKLKVYLDSADDMTGCKTLFIGGREFAVINVRPSGEFAYVALRGVADRDAAELLRGKEIEAYRSELKELPEGRYYIADLLGCAVEYENGERVGEVISVTPARTDIYTLRTAGGEISFAAASGVILNVDAENKKITVSKKKFKEVSV